MAASCGSAGLIVGVLALLAVAYECKRDNAELQKKIVLRENELQKRKTEEQEMAQVVITLQEPARGLEEMRQKKFQKASMPSVPHDRMKRGKAEFQKKIVLRENELQKRKTEEQEMAQVVITLQEPARGLEEMRQKKFQKASMPSVPHDRMKRGKAEFQKKIVLRENELQKRKTEEQEMAQVVITLQEPARGLEEMRQKKFQKASMPSVPHDRMKRAASSADDTPSTFAQSGFTSDCIPMAVACGSAGLIVGVLVVLAVVYKCKREKAESVKRNTQLQKESLKTEEEREDVVNTLMELNTELENQRGRLKELLEEVEGEREVNKQNLQAVEKEITEREAAFDKPEELLREKEDLLQAQWKLDQTKKDNERQLLNTERLLEAIEIQVNKIHRKKEEDFG
ncbi:uncharacterized protein LOC116052093 [Sander lucioperca]|uniref:uncharacterized protein LOC116052093 n=1 Tax=Sander lucioperca TaxID=283035 RepID=UPI00125DE516|nr:uncharacterized protein LOC116052093 [Sander lucioperca]